MKTTTKGHIALSIAGILFGINYWVAKKLMPELSPMQVVAFRLVFSTALIWITSFFFKEENKIQKKDFIVLFFAGILGLTLNQTLFFAGLNLSSPVEVSILHTLSPVFVALMAFFLLKEKLSARVVFGIITGLIGTIIIVTDGKNLSFSDTNLKGNLLIIANILSYSIYLIITKPLMSKYNSVQVLKYVFLFGLLAYLPILPFTFNSFDYTSISISTWYNLAYVIIGTTFLTYLLTIYGLKQLPANIVGYYIYLQPFLATTIGYVYGLEYLSIPKLIATGFLFFGVWLVLGGKARRIKT